MEQEEAMFRAIHARTRENRKPGDYYSYVAKGSQTDVAFHGVHSTFIDVLQGKLLQKQARLDAAMAIENCKGGVSRKERKESQEEREKRKKKKKKKKKMNITCPINRARYTFNTMTEL